jgi:dTDP-4-dehydrorhamnose reductase
VRVVVLGGSGMLGSTVAAVLASEPGLEVHASVRSSELLEAFRDRLPAARWFRFDAEAPSAAALPRDARFFVNAIGVIKPYIQDHDSRSVERAIAVNAAFPHWLAARAAESGASVLQIATDCVYSGTKGRSLESAAHDPWDVYGKTKSLGEVRAPKFHNLRCSIVGPEAKERRSLLEWFLGQPRGATVDGYTNHLWNGITTLHFARLVRGIVLGGLALPALQHVVPADEITKADLLGLFARSYERSDVTIVPRAAEVGVDRTLATADPAFNEALWRAAGYERPPTLADMIRELAAFSYPLGDLLAKGARA